MNLAYHPRSDDRDYCVQDDFMKGARKLQVCFRFHRGGTSAMTGGPYFRFRTR